MRFLLDTNAIIAILSGKAGITQRIRQYQPADFAVSSIVMHELYFGAYKSGQRSRNMAVVDGLLFEVLPFDLDDARHAGEIRAFLAAQGTPIGGYDVLIAGQARARGLILITRNEREFKRVDGLDIENWER
ncbi:MAG: type II toxin-antitoxin system VapC family toxin [Thermodesulfobacteriota bacterium]